MASRSWVRGTISVNALLSFIFGLIFITAMLVLAVAVPNPSGQAQKTFTTVLALAAAGVGAVLPGYLHIRHVPLVRAGGAIALFIIVYFFRGDIVSNVASFPVPREDPTPTYERVVAAVDSGDFQRTWNAMEAGFKALGIPPAEGKQLFTTARRGLGPVEKREIVSTGMSTNLPGYPPGRYKLYQTRTKFANVQFCRPEAIWLRAADANSWEGFSYQIGFQDIPCQ
jgi:hypothetical protein